MTTLYRDRLPRILASDHAFSQFVRIFEDVGSPLYDVSGAFPAMFDPHTASAEIARWLGGWLGLAVDETLTGSRRSRLVVAAADHFGIRASGPALEALIGAATGSPVDVADPGGTYRAGHVAVDVPGEVVVTCASLGGLPIERIETLLRSQLPTWLAFRIVVDPSFEKDDPRVPGGDADD